MLKKILIAFVSLLGLMLVVGLVLPTTYRVERSLLILAPSEAVYAHVASPRRWREWAAWSETRQPGGTWTFGGPEEGVGSVRSWSGEGVGRGTLSLSEVNPVTGVAYQASLDDGRVTARGHLSFAPEETGTRVTWVEEGRLGGGPLRGYLVPFVRARLGGGFEEGLARLKRVAETAVPASPLEQVPFPAESTSLPAPAEPPSAPVSAPVMADASPSVPAASSPPAGTHEQVEPATAPATPVFPDAGALGEPIPQASPDASEPGDAGEPSGPHDAGLAP